LKPGSGAGRVVAYAEALGHRRTRKQVGSMEGVGGGGVAIVASQNKDRDPRPRTHARERERDGTRICLRACAWW
jgi:hypothetical protein